MAFTWAEFIWVSLFAAFLSRRHTRSEGLVVLGWPEWLVVLDCALRAAALAYVAARLMPGLGARMGP